MGRSDSPRVSVVLPCRNEAAHIQKCLDGVLAFDEPEGGFEVVIADGMSDDGTREMLQTICRQDRRLSVVDNPDRLTPAGLNAAISMACGQVIVRIDAHTRYASDYLVQCIKVLQKTGADNVGGPARTEATGWVQRAVAAAYHSRFSVGGARFHDVDFEGPVDTVTYGCWPRATFDRFGFFDEELVRNQDDEHNLRIVRGGGVVWQSPSICSWYSPRGSLTGLFNQYQQYGFWKVRVIQKHRLPASIRHLVPGAFMLGLATGLMGGFWLPALWITTAAVLGLYFLTVSVVSLRVAGQTEWALLPVLPAVFPCYHFGYGIGFLKGFFNFLIFRRRPNKKWKALTRKDGDSSRITR